MSSLQEQESKVRTLEREVRSLKNDLCHLKDDLTSMTGDRDNAVKIIKFVIESVETAGEKMTAGDMGALAAMLGQTIALVGNGTDKKEYSKPSTPEKKTRPGLVTPEETERS
ncbi:hypothetical protein MKZ38_003827 [Zalerion maritima]|uniref:Uncharacterized protein n=1 Tax=Zalerion maritima TaxID=339359 RepID=A0AAD5WQE3_9PEZI|nr:hypothetical protein MKZ38_003827 [Zalerion maritima]